MSEAKSIAPPILDEDTRPSGVAYLNKIRGTEKRRSADRKTNFRKKGSPVLGVSLALDDGTSPLHIHTIINIAITLAMDKSDIDDGRDGKESNELLGIADDDPIAIKGGEDDQKADKVKYRSQMFGLIARLLVHDHSPKEASFVAVNTGLQTLRDVEMQRTREVAKANNIKANARDIGRLKAWPNAAGAGLLTITPMLPEKYKRQATKLANVCLVAGTALSGLALVDMKLHVNRELERQKTDAEFDDMMTSIRTDNCDNELLTRIFPVDTNQEPS